jgi:hypothetical protein
MAITAMLGVATASASPAHAHLKTPDAGCDICFTAHITAVDTPCAYEFLAPQVGGVLPILPVQSGYQPCESESSCSRGPPSFLQ